MSRNQGRNRSPSQAKGRGKPRNPPSPVRLQSPGRKRRPPNRRPRGKPSGGQPSRPGDPGERQRQDPPHQNKITGRQIYDAEPGLPTRTGVSQSILEGLDEILTANRLGLPPDLRRAGLHQHHREHEQRHSPGMPECEALAERKYGIALDCRVRAGSEEGLQAPQGPQASAVAQSCTSKPS